MIQHLARCSASAGKSVTFFDLKCNLRFTDNHAVKAGGNGKQMRGDILIGFDIKRFFDECIIHSPEISKPFDLTGSNGFFVLSKRYL